MIHKFVYEFDDDMMQRDMAIDQGPPSDAKIRFDVQNGAEIWVYANRPGWAHLARVCAELAMRSDYDPGDHFHRGYDLREVPRNKLAVSFALEN